MEEQNMAPGPEASEVVEEGGKRRQRSSIQFPYNDLDDAVAVAQAIHRNVGLGACGLDQLVAWMGHESVASGAFRIKLSAARTFGLVEIEKKQLSLTALGRDVVNPEKALQAKVQAFLHVPLYKAVFDKYRGHVLPIDSGLEGELVGLGVAKKQADRARQTLQRSAEQAGFFGQGKNKLVLPAEGPAQSAMVRPPSTPEPEIPPGLPKPPGHLGQQAWHPLIQGLLDTLPAPGAEWPDDKRKRWLQIAEHTFALIYKDGS